MSQPLALAQSREIPIDVEEAFRSTMAVPLPDLFRRWYGPIPPIKKVTGQVGDWDGVGQTRTVHLTGGGSLYEELTDVAAPHSFGYTLTEIKGPMAALIGKVDGRWSFAPTATGTTVTWQWTVHPRSVLSRPALPVFGMLWRNYARRALEDLSALLRT